MGWMGWLSSLINQGPMVHTMVCPSSNNKTLYWHGLRVLHISIGQGDVCLTACRNCYAVNGQPGNNKFRHDYQLKVNPDPVTDSYAHRRGYTIWYQPDHDHALYALWQRAYIMSEDCSAYNAAWHSWEPMILFKHKSVEHEQRSYLMPVFMAVHCLASGLTLAHTKQSYLIKDSCSH